MPPIDFGDISSVGDPGVPDMRPIISPSSRPREVGADGKALAERIARLSLICEAMWTILREQHGYTDEMLALRVAELDAADGHVDGRKPNVLVRCAKCSRALAAGKQVCLYCGALNEHAPVFNGFA